MNHAMPLSRLDGLRYGLLGLPLAFCALPLYVLMPHYYATQWGVPLAALGSVLLALRLFDAVLDPWIGRLCDHLARSGDGALLRAMVPAALALAVGFAALFNPLATSAPLLVWVAASLGLTYLAYSFITVAHQAWGARLGHTAAQRSTVVAWREGLGLVGVVLASAAPALWGVGALGWLMALALGAGVVALAFAPRTHVQAQAVGVERTPLWAPWRQPAFVRLVVVFALNGVATAVPATLVLFFIQDRVQADTAHQGVFLGVYFLCAAVSMPLWLRAVKRWALERTWLGGMVLSVAAFVGAALVGAGDLAAYAVVCALSGLALGSDLAIPAALLAQVLGRDGRRQSGAQEGMYFGWWNFVAKLNLALAAGVTLPALAWLGYTPGAQSSDSLLALTAVYCLLPCALKAAAAAALYVYFIRPQGDPGYAT